MLDIRHANTGDIPILVPLVAEYWRFESISKFNAERIATQLTRLLSAPTLGAGWIATVDSAAAGYLLAVYVFSLEHLGLTAEIDEFFVLAAHRARGVGAALLRVAETEFVRVDCTHVSLQLARNNDAGRAFYDRHGYGARDGYELLDKALGDR